MSKNTTVPAVEKALTILQYMSASSQTSWGITELANELNITKSTVYSILNTMIHYRYIEKNTSTGKYLLGPGLFEIAGTYYKHNPIRLAFESVTTPIHLKLMECINCHILRNYASYVLSTFSSDNFMLRVEMPEGTSLPPIYSSAGKVLLGDLSDMEIKKIYNTCLEEASAKEAPPWPEFLEQIRIIRREQCAFNMAEYENGVYSVAAPVKNYNNQIVAAVNIVAPEARFKRNKDLYINNIKEIAKKTSEQLGCLNYDMI